MLGGVSGMWWPQEAALQASALGVGVQLGPCMRPLLHSVFLKIVARKRLISD